MLRFVRLARFYLAVAGRAVRGLRDHRGRFHDQRLILRGDLGSTRGHLHLEPRQTIVQVLGRRRVSKK